MLQVKDRKRIAKIIRKKIKDKKINKIDICRNTGLSRHTVYKIVQEGGREENYSLDSLFKICKELDIKVLFI